MPVCQSLVCHWSVTGLSLFRLCSVTGSSLACLWSVTGPSLVCLWSVTGLSLLRHWSVVILSSCQSILSCPSVWQASKGVAALRRAASGISSFDLGRFPALYRAERRPGISTTSSHGQFDKRLLRLVCRPAFRLASQTPPASVAYLSRLSEGCHLTVSVSPAGGISQWLWPGLREMISRPCRT